MCVSVCVLSKDEEAVKHRCESARSRVKLKVERDGFFGPSVQAGIAFGSAQ